MNQRVSAARAFAAAAVVGGFLVVVVVVAISVSGGDDGGRDGRSQTVETRSGDRKTPRAYVVQNGDTLTSIARRVGVSVARIQDPNPGLDPQILVSGEKLKLR